MLSFEEGIELSYEYHWLISYNEIKKRIEEELDEILSKKFATDITMTKVKLTEGIQQITRKHIEHHPTFQSAVRGELLGELGLPMDRRIWAAGEMINLIAAGIEVQFSADLKSALAVLNVHVIWSNEKIQELLNRGEATYISSSGKPGLGGGSAKHQIDWLEWLLDGSGGTLISGFHIEYGDFPGSRTHMAIMEEGGSWSMPYGDYARHNNFITQSIERATPEIVQFVLNNLEHL